jgi:F0F1-type ATP synthase alpha subunit
VFLALNNGLLDNVEESKISQAQDVIQQVLKNNFANLLTQWTEKREKLSEKDKDTLIKTFQQALIKKGIITTK